MSAIDLRSFPYHVARVQFMCLFISWHHGLVFVGCLAGMVLGVCIRRIYLVAMACHEALVQEAPMATSGHLGSMKKGSFMEELLRHCPAFAVRQDFVVVPGHLHRIGWGGACAPRSYRICFH